jgi:hypothetical protein
LRVLVHSAARACSEEWGVLGSESPFGVQCACGVWWCAVRQPVASAVNYCHHQILGQQHMMDGLRTHPNGGRRRGAIGHWGLGKRRSPVACGVVMGGTTACRVVGAGVGRALLLIITDYDCCHFLISARHRTFGLLDGRWTDDGPNARRTGSTLRRTENGERRRRTENDT